MLFCYCPNCGRKGLWEDLGCTDYYVINTCAEQGKPIYHYTCTCGNCLAGGVSIVDITDEMLAYYKQKIRDYNFGGAKYSQVLYDLCAKETKVRRTAYE